jgi:hypothetical protein
MYSMICSIVWFALFIALYTTIEIFICKHKLRIFNKSVMYRGFLIFFYILIF